MNKPTCWIDSPGMGRAASSWPASWTSSSGPSSGASPPTRVPLPRPAGGERRPAHGRRPGAGDFQRGYSDAGAEALGLPAGLAEEETWLAGGGLPPLRPVGDPPPGGQPHPPGLPGGPHGPGPHPGEDRGHFAHRPGGPGGGAAGDRPHPPVPVDPGGEVPGEAGPPAPGPTHPHPGGAEADPGHGGLPPAGRGGVRRVLHPPEPGGRPDPGRPGGGEPPPLRQGRQGGGGRGCAHLPGPGQVCAARLGGTPSGAG